jgi:N-acyl-D-amino-acid deacylase
MPHYRRTLTALGLAIAVLGARGNAGEGAADPFDVVIRGGMVLDGTGDPAVRADVAIRKSRIVSVGVVAESVAARRIVDATGQIVAPGFIDVHSHAAEGFAGRMADAGPILMQGVTTVFINPDGGGPVDLAKQRKAFEARGVGVNVGQFVPQGSIRENVIGLDDRAPTDDELPRMERLVADGMRPLHWPLLRARQLCEDR